MDSPQHCTSKGLDVLPWRFEDCGLSTSRGACENYNKANDRALGGYSCVLECFSSVPYELLQVETTDEPHFSTLLLGMLRKQNRTMRKLAKRLYATKSATEMFLETNILLQMPSNHHMRAAFLSLSSSYFTVIISACYDCSQPPAPPVAGGSLPRP